MNLLTGSITSRLYTDKGESEQGRFALEVASKSLDFYEEYFRKGLPDCLSFFYDLSFFNKTSSKHENP